MPAWATVVLTLGAAAIGVQRRHERRERLAKERREDGWRAARIVAAVLARASGLLGKAVRPLPAKSRLLKDTETRARQRYLDLIVTPDARRVADAPARAIAGIRSYPAGRGFTAVGTPVLQPDARH